MELVFLVSSFAALVVLPLLCLAWTKVTSTKPASDLSRDGLDELPGRSNMVGPADWIEAKRESDYDAKNFWKVHDQLYDLTSFKHPGGKDWIDHMKGTDCTEAFEAHHINIKKARAVLSKYKISSDLSHEESNQSEAKKEPRFTYNEGDFYQVLRGRVAAAVGKETDATPSFALMRIVFLVLWILSFALLCFVQSTWSAILSGIFLMPMWGIGHNAFHQKDSIWMYTTDLTSSSSYEWRVTHALSHHLYPNTKLDIEVSALEPLLAFLSCVHRTLKHKVSILYYQIVLSAMPIIVFTMRTIMVLSGKIAFRKEFALNPLQLAILIGVAGPKDGLILFLIMHITNSWMLTSVGLLPHHNTFAWHEGDGQIETDFGIHQVRTVMDHSTKLPLPLSLLFFAFLNDHTLHHLFPTLDHSQFDKVRPILIETCKEFGIQYKESSFFYLYAGLVRKLWTEGQMEFDF